MTQTFTDFTKARLTQAFEAKGNAGSSLSETIQPIVQLHNLEAGPFAPSSRFSWVAVSAATVGEFGMVAIGPNIDAVEETIIIDRIYLSTAAAAMVFQVGVTNAPTIGTTTAPFSVWPHDRRTGATYRYDASFILTQGSNPTAPIVAGFIHDGVIPTGNMTAVDIAVVFDRKGYASALTTPQLYVVGATNAVFRATFHGRIFPIQS